MVRSSLRLGVVLTLISSCAACSVNGFGIGADRQVQQTSTAKIVNYKAIGLHLYNEAGFGFQLGRTERTLVYPVLNHNDMHCIEHILGSPAPNNSPVKYANQAIMIDNQFFGLGLGVSPIHLQINLGMSNKKMLLAQSDTLFTFFYNNSLSELQICANIVYR